MFASTGQELRNNAFLNIYGAFLLERVLDSPDEYGYPATDVPTVARRMVFALRGGFAHIQSAPIKQTCKALGIKHNGRAIRAYLNELEWAVLAAQGGAGNDR